MTKITPPEHYQGWLVGDFILKMDLGFFLGNAVKYLCRYKKKNGKEDLTKMLDYLQYVERLTPGQKAFVIAKQPNILDIDEVKSFSNTIELSMADFYLLYLICQYNATGIDIILTDAICYTSERIYNFSKKEVSHVSN